MKKLIGPASNGNYYVLLTSKNTGVSIRRIFCLSAVMIGLFITAEPTIFNIDSDGSSDSGGPELSQAARILWPCAFAFGFVPVAIGYVLTEKEMKREEVKMNQMRKILWRNFQNNTEIVQES